MISKKRALAAGLLCAIASVGFVADVQADEMMKHDLDEVVIEGSQNFYAGEQVVRESNIGVLGNVDFMEIPINAISFSNKTITNNAAPGTTLNEVVTLDPGVISRGSSAYNDIYIRGFGVSNHDFYVNGIPGMMSQSSIPTNFVENIEVISGPNTLINGVSVNGSIGGAVNLVPKKASGQDVLKFTETFSGKSNFEHAIDFGTRFGENMEWGVRVNADFADGETVRRNENMHRGNVFINIDRENEKSKSSLIYGFREVDQDAPSLGLKLGDQQVPDAPKGDVNFQVPWARYAYNNNFIALSHEQKLSDDWKWFLKGGYHDEDWYQCLESYLPTLKDANGNFEAGSIEDVPIKFWRRTIVTGFQGNVETGNLDHNIVVSADKVWQKGKGADWFPDDLSFNGNIYDPSIIEGATNRPNIALGDWYYSGETTLSGISLIDRITTDDDKLSFLLGLRRQKIVSRSSHDGTKYVKHGEKTATSPSFGVMYKVQPNLSVYANYIEGLSKGKFVSSRYANGNEFLEPQETKQYEFGVKWDNDNLAATLSAFKVQQENAYADPVTNIYDYHGEQNNKGVELTVYGKPADKWNVIGGVMYLDPKQNGGADDGKQITSLPEWHSSIFVEYECDDKLSFTGRVLYNGSAYADSKNSKKIPSWTRFDLGANYKTSMGSVPVTLGFNVFNVFDKHYWYGGGDNKVFLGDARTAVISATFDI